MRMPPFIFRIDQTVTCSDSTCIRTSDTYILSKIAYFCKCFTSGQTGKTILENGAYNATVIILMICSRDHGADQFDNNVTAGYEGQIAERHGK